MKQYELFKLSPIEIYKMVLRGDLKAFPRGFWQRPEAEQNAIIVTKFLLEDILKWSENDIKSKLLKSTFDNNKLGGMINTIFNGSPFNAINLTYPNKYNIWDFTQTPKNYWNKETSLKAIKWMIEDKLQWNSDDIKTKLTKQTFKDNNLSGMLQIVYNESPYDAINNFYPNKFKPWELKAPNNYWNKESGIEATKWLIEEKLKLSYKDIKEKLSFDLFIKNSLGGMLACLYNNSYEKAIKEAYPKLII